MMMALAQEEPDRNQWHSVRQPPTVIPMNIPGADGEYTELKGCGYCGKGGC